MTKGRKLHLDLLRIIAIFLVVYNHTGINGCSYYYAIHDSLWHFPLMVLAYVMRCAVPVFFMISGALLLKKNEAIKTLYRKRVLRFLIVLVVASLISYLYKIRQDFAQFSLIYFLNQLYSYNLCYSYWFLYQYLAWLICLPFLRRMAQNMKNEDFLYLFAIVAVVNLMTFAPLAVLGEPTSYSKNFAPFVLNNTVFYPLAGYYLEERVPESEYCKKNTLILFLLFVVSAGITVVAQNYWCENYLHWELGGAEGYLSTLGFVPAILLYYMSKLLFIRFTAPKVFQKLISLLGSCSLGVYLFQHIYLEMTSDLWLRTAFGTWLGTVLWVVEVCLIGTAVTIILKQIPGVKKLL